MCNMELFVLKLSVNVSYKWFKMWPILPFIGKISNQMFDLFTITNSREGESSEILFTLFLLQKIVNFID